MTGDCHVRICEGLGVKFPRATRLADFRHRLVLKIDEGKFRLPLPVVVSLVLPFRIQYFKWKSLFSWKIVELGEAIFPLTPQAAA